MDKKQTNLERNIQSQKRINQERIKNKQAPKVYNLIKDYSVNQNRPPKGNPTGTCKKCGKTFDQPFSEERNAYSSWRICPECRKKASEEQTEKFLQEASASSNVFTATLKYTPYEWQKEAEEAFNNHRFIVLSCGNRCLFKGAFINGADKPIELLTKKDRVISKNGELQKIINLWTEEYKGDIYVIKGNGIEPIRCTDNHPFMVAYARRKTLDEQAKIYKERLVCANELIKEQNLLGEEEHLYLKIPRIKGNISCKYWNLERSDNDKAGQLIKVRLNEDNAWLMGLYCSVGEFSKDGHLQWPLNNKIITDSKRLCSILDMLGFDYHITQAENGNFSVIVNDKQFCDRINKEIGYNVKDKKIPRDILYNKNERLLIAFLQGYYTGGGSLNKSLATLNTTTASRTLAQQLQIAWARLGFFVKIDQYQKSKLNVNNAQDNIDYNITLSTEKGIRLSGYEVSKKREVNTAIITKDAVYTELYSVNYCYGEELIYGLSTFDESFASNGIISRNSGKDRFSTMVGIKYFVKCLNENRAVKRPDLVPAVYWWIVAPTEKMAKQNWRELKQFFPKRWIVAASDSDYQMETVGGGIIEVRSGYSSEDLVGVGLDLVTVTEAARFKDLHLAWSHLEARLNSAGRGLAKDRVTSDAGQGKAIINSSPRGKNDFYDLFCRGQEVHMDYSSLWWSKKYPWTCNPVNAEQASKIVQTKFGELTYEETLRRQLGDRTFRSNYLGDFLAEDATVFKNFEQNCVLNIYDEEATGLKTKRQREEFIAKWKTPIPGEAYIGGYDPATGSSGDSPAFVIRHEKSNKIVRVYDLYGKTYDQQYDFIASICKLFNYATLHWLRTGHTAVEGQFEKRGIVEVPIDEQGQNKGKLVQTLELAVENGDLQVLYDGSPEVQTLIYQMNDYTEHKGKYSNDKVPHDDFVSALYAAFSDYSINEVPVSAGYLWGSL